MAKQTERKFFFCSGGNAPKRWFQYIDNSGIPCYCCEDCASSLEAARVGQRNTDAFIIVECR